MTHRKLRRIGVLTGGGDAPGLNCAIRAVTLKAHELGIETVGIYDGWAGVLPPEPGSTDLPEVWPLDETIVRRWDRDGGTNLGSSRTNPFKHRVHVKKGTPGSAGHGYADDGEKGPMQTLDRSAEVLATIDRLGLDALCPIGGEDTLGVGARLAALGAPVVGIPKTIDRDLGMTDYTLGFDTSMRTCTEIIERSHHPAGSHHWVQIVEVMGRHAGHLALWSGLAGGADMILIPEVPFELDKVIAVLDAKLARGLSDRRHPRHAVVVVAEGATAAGRDNVTVDGGVDAFGHARLGGIGAWLAENIRKSTRWDTRAVALGHPQRGGVPSATDRIMGHLFGISAVEAATHHHWGRMVSAKGVAPACEINLVDIAEAVKELRLVDVAKHYDPERYFAAGHVLGVHRSWNLRGAD